MILVYAVTLAARDSEAAVAGTHLRAHESSGLTAFVEDRAVAPERTTREVLAFARVLQDLWSRITLLPVRFGTTVEHDGELDALVARHRTEWTDRLAAVNGHSECIVHVQLAPDPAAAGAWDPSPGRGRESGSDYLQRRAREVGQQVSATAEVRELLAPYCSEVAALPPVRTDEARLSFLVRDELVDAARNAVLDWAGNRSGVSLTGPWPPFSFCREVIA